MLAALAVLIGLASAARADASDDRRALIMLRVLAYDNHLRERAGDQVGIVIVYSAGDGGAAERARWTSAFASARKLKVDGRPVVVTAHKFESARSLDRALQELHAAGLVACDGLAKALPVGELAALTRAHKVLSFSTREREVVDGLAVGIVPGSEREEIVVNLRAATAEGVKFDAGLLQLARAVEAGR
jgi:YfiR/HmsC-like